MENLIYKRFIACIKAMVYGNMPYAMATQIYQFAYCKNYLNIEKYVGIL